MNTKPYIRRASALLAGICCLGATSGAFAQEDGAVAERSIWSVIGEGIHWPAYLIFAGSFVVIALIIDQFVSVRRATICPAEQFTKTRRLIERQRFRECIDSLKKSPTFFAKVMSSALRQSAHGFEAMSEAAHNRSSELTGRMFRQVEYLNMLGNMGPLIGLLGTVYGMIIAFNALGAAGGSASGDAGGLALGISLALVNTLLGLILAVVGLGFFGWCRNRVDALTVEATVEALNMLEYFRPTARPGAAPVSAPASGRTVGDPDIPAGRGRGSA